jgi:hypothetical protein
MWEALMRAVDWRLLVITAVLAGSAEAQSNQQFYHFEDSVGRQVTCGVGQIGARQTRSVSRMGRLTSLVDNEPTDAVWNETGCASYVRERNRPVSQTELQARVDAISNPPPLPSFDQLMGRMFPNGPEGQREAARLEMTRTLTSALAREAGRPVTLSDAWGYIEPDGALTYCGFAQSALGHASFVVLLDQPDKETVGLGVSLDLMQEAGCGRAEGKIVLAESEL